MNKNMPNQHINKEKPIEAVRELVKKNLVVPVVADAGVFEAGTYDFPVTYDEYYSLLKKQAASLSIITTMQV